MKLTPESIDQLNKLLSVSALVSIENIAIEDGVARGVDEKKTVVIISDQNIPSFGEGVKAGLSRLPMLAQRLNLIKGKNDIEVEVKVSATNEVSQLEISGSGAKVQYRGAGISTIKAPKSINATPLWHIEIPVEMLALIQNGARAMDTKKAIINRKGGKEVFIEFVDSNQDIFSLKIADTATYIGEGDEPNSVFIHYYRFTEILLPLMKAAALENEKVITIIISNIGTLQILVSGHMFTIIPTMATE